MPDADNTSIVSSNSAVSISSAIILTRARRAAFETKHKEALKRAELEKRRTQIALELEQHGIDTEIAAAAAEEAVLVVTQENNRAELDLPLTNYSNIDAPTSGPVFVDYSPNSSPSPVLNLGCNEQVSLQSPSYRDTGNAQFCLKRNMTR